MDKLQADQESTSKADAFRYHRLENEANGRLVQLEAQVSDLKGVLAALDRENDLNRARVVEMRNSMSWKITRPIRRARRLVSRVLGRLAAE